MSKIPFSIKYRPQIESGEYKVETKNGRQVRVVCWDVKNSHSKVYNDILALFVRGYPSASEAARQLGLYKSGVVSCCNGFYPTYHGFVFKYKLPGFNE